MKIPIKRELQQIAMNNSSDIDYKDFIKQLKTIEDQGQKKVEALNTFNLTIN